jgi:hypothetical protein
MNATMEIRQNTDTTYRGSLRADAWNSETNSDASGRFLKTGTGTLHLHQVDIYSRGLLDGSGNKVALEVQQGTVVASDYIWSEGGILKVNGSGATLRLDNVDVDMDVLVQAGSLTGNGYLDEVVTIGSSGILSPGLTGPSALGMFEFGDTLVLKSGGTYHWQIRSALDPAEHDLLLFWSLADLVVESTPESPFTIRVESLSLADTAGALAGFDPSQMYTWTLATQYEENTILAGPIDLSKFALDVSLFTANNSLDYGQGNGYFTLTQDGTKIMLNFMPVPEPSTYVLIGLGLGLVAFTTWRRRR